jgi:hypothetical protein
MITITHTKKSNRSSTAAGNKSFCFSQTLKDFVVKCMTVAAHKGHTSVSLPCLGTGYTGYPHTQAAAMLFEAVTEYDKNVSSTCVQSVNFVALNSDQKSIGVYLVFQIVVNEIGYSQDVQIPNKCYIK